MTTPTAFISYSWDDEDHKASVKGLAERLRAGGVNVLLDIWGVAPGGQLPEFMEGSVSDSDFVLVICTPATGNAQTDVAVEWDTRGTSSRRR